MSLPVRLYRRYFTRALASIACAGLLGACMGAPTGDVKPAVALALRPVFSAAAGAAGVTVDHIRIVLTRPPSTQPLVDTTIALSAGQDSVSVQLSVRLLPTDDHLQADIEVLGGGIVYYHGTSDIVLQNGQQSGTTSAVTVAYVGPGAGATSIAIAQRQVSVPATATVAFTASVLDANGHAIAGVPIGWSVSDPTLGAISDSGLFAGAGRRGTGTVFAVTPTGLRDSVPLVLLPAPTHLTVVGGDAQSTPAGATLPQPIVVEADAVDGPVSGVTVHFDAGTSGARIAPDSAVSDAGGRVSVHIVLGTITGTQHFSATAPGLAAVALSATATAVPVAIAKVSGDAQADSLGRTLAPFVVKVTDAFGNAAPGATVAWSVIGGTGSLAAATTTTDASGSASTAYTLSSTSRIDSVRAALAGTTASVVFSATAFARGAAKLVVTAGDAQTGVVGAALPVSFGVQAFDAIGNPVAGAAVTFASVSPGASVYPKTALTDAKGLAAAAVTLGGTPGVQTFSATAGSATVVVHETAIAGAPALLLKVAGDGQSDVACAVLKSPLVVRATDLLGNGVPAATVTWAQVGGPGSHNVSPLLTDSLGFSTVFYQLPNGAGVDTLTATLKNAPTQMVTFLATITTTSSTSCSPPPSSLPDRVPAPAGDRAASAAAWPSATGGVFSLPARRLRLP